jgi:hypothetical protein
MTISFYWLDPDGGSTQLGQVSASKVKEFSGLGMAPVEHFLQSLPSQHRQLHRGLKFRPRVVQLGIWDHQASAAAQDTRHQTLLTALNSDRGEGTLKAVLSDGSTTRYLDCYVQEGPDFSSGDRPLWAGHQFYVVRFVAPDPFLYDPSQQSANGNFNGATPVNIAVTNSGHIGTYPTLIITGAVNTPKVMLVSTGEYIEFAYNLTAGHHIDIDCQEGTIKLDDSVMAPLTLTKPSTLFAISRGSQILRLTATSGTGAFSCAFYNRYLGI